MKSDMSAGLSFCSTTQPEGSILNREQLLRMTWPEIHAFFGITQRETARIVVPAQTERIVTKQWLEKRRDDLEHAETKLAEAARILGPDWAAEDLQKVLSDVTLELDRIYAQLARLARK